ncbi:MAG: ribosome small subunit-dependent GTPase A [Candidatus Zixiibacteriota bacterium]
MICSWRKTIISFQNARGIVVRGHGKAFIVRSEHKDIPCEIRGKVKYDTDSTTPVAVGDEVCISINPDGTGMIESVEKRRSMFFRPAKGLDSKKQVIAANIDRLAAVVSVLQPPLKPGLIDRFLISAEIGGLEPLVIFNKIDLGRPILVEELRKVYKNLGISCHIVSAITREGCEELAADLASHMTIFAGHSGVGKSTILNRLIPGLNIRVSPVSESTDKGVHTTTKVELYELPNGGYVVDSPGLKILGLWEVSRTDLAGFFPEMSEFCDNCRFAGCSHTHEPDCAVKQAVSKGQIAEFRYKSYLTIYKSL